MSPCFTSLAITVYTHILSCLPFPVFKLSYPCCARSHNYFIRIFLLYLRTCTQFCTCPNPLGSSLFYTFWVLNFPSSFFFFGPIFVLPCYTIWYYYLLILYRLTSAASRGLSSFSFEEAGTSTPVSH